MRREGLTVRDATEMWVSEMNAIPKGMIDKLMRSDPDDWHEVTKPSGGDRVYVYEVPDGCDHYGEIVEYDEDEEKWNILLDSHETIGVSEEDFEMDRDSFCRCGVRCGASAIVATTGGSKKATVFR